MNTISPYKVKWAIVVPVSDSGLSENYKKALKECGFSQMSNFYVNHFNSDNQKSVERFTNDVKKLYSKITKSKLNSKNAVLSFIITDKQFGMIGSGYIMKSNVPTKLGNIPVTYKQMYEYGCIPLPGSQRCYNHPNLVIYEN